MWARAEGIGIVSTDATGRDGAFVGVVNACASIAALEDSKRVHEQIIQRGFESFMFVGNSLVDMYAKCGSIEDALRVFNRMSTRNVVVWSAIILGHVKCGQGHKALELSSQCNRKGWSQTLSLLWEL
jgi:pentatricopeptide repeat protein